jgi:hypothetical protein
MATPRTVLKHLMAGVSLASPLPPALAPTFDIFIDQQPEHIAALLPHIQWYCHDTYDFCDQASDLSHALLVTDGGAADNMGTFGWIIGTTSGTHLAAGSDPVFGFDPRSYRAETYGCRAGMTFVQLVFQFCRRTMTGTLEVRFDNQGLLKKRTSFRKFALAKYSAALHSEWNAVISVYNPLDRFPNLPVLKHVNGHQDEDIASADLPLDAQMNIVEADALATMKLSAFSSTLHQVPFDPESQVMLSIDGTTVTWRLETTIRTKARLPALITYYWDRHNWDQRTFHADDWDTFGGVFPKIKQRNFITKFCFYTLPAGNSLHRRDSMYDNRCLICHAPNEMDDHVLQCLSLARRAWRSDLIGSLLKPIDSFLDPVLLDILWKGLL